MFLPSRRLCCLLGAAAVACTGLPEPAMANAAPAYLNWRSKAAPPAPPVAPQAMVTSGGESYAVPPSPYGQVGDPFARALNWPAKANTKAKQVASIAPLPVPSAPRPAPIAVPAPPVVIEPKSPVASIAAPVPVPAPRPVSVPKPVTAPIAPQASAAPAPGSVLPAPSGYQVPTTSKYAARIASARAAQAREEAAQIPPKAPAKAATATVPAPSASLASQETDHVFIPGEQFTDAREAPRFYSLHRAYGLAPDPITVDHNATGAILGTTDLNADEGEAKDDDTKTASSSSHDKP